MKLLFKGRRGGEEHSMLRKIETLSPVIDSGGD